jgi:trigger factor
MTDPSTTTLDDEQTAAEIAEPTAPAAAKGEKRERHHMDLAVTITDAGPCKKHVQVRVPKDDIHHYYMEAVGEMIDSAEVPGFRVGKAPKQLIQKRYRKELYHQVKQQVLIDSLEQMAEEHELDPINEPDLDLENLEIHGDRDFEYEFEVEVRPRFELPDYTGLLIQRPVREITDADVAAFEQRFLAQYGEHVERDGPAEQDDFVLAAVELSYNGRPLKQIKSLKAQLKPVLRFQDAELQGFDLLMAGVTPGDTREADLTVSVEAEQIEMRGEPVQAVFKVKGVERLQMPELDKEFFDRIGVESEEDLRGQIRSILERQQTYAQRQSARQQVLEKITDSANWELPEDLVLRQTENALRREILEMQQAGFTTQEIHARENQLRQRAISTTRQALKEHFVLDKVGQKEEIEVTLGDIDTEIMMMAFQRGESPRRVRARLEKSGMIENLQAQIYERKAIDSILEKATYEDVPIAAEPEVDVEAVAHSVCGPDGSGAGESLAVGAGEE